MDIARVKSQFLSNYQTPRLSVPRDGDVYRHVVISGAPFYHFELVTWPGMLFVNCEGDGYCFSRTKDMFSFFRRGGDASELDPNFGYWAEKLTDPRSRNVRMFDYQAFEADVEKALKEISNEARVEEIREDLEFETNTQDEHSCREFLYRHAEFGDLAIDGQWEDWTFRYAYACFAIVFGIREYERAAMREARQPIFPAEWLDDREEPR